MLKNLNTVFLGHNFISLSEIDSTNRFLSQLLSENPPDGTVIMAEKQKNGKGQMGTSWFSESGKNLTFSMLLHPSFLQADQMFILSKMAAVALREAVQFFLPNAPVMIKWPNDILVEKKKVAGILIENQLEGNFLKHTIIGIGLNINQLMFPPEIQHTAISMKLYSGIDFPVSVILEKILEKTEYLYHLLKEGKTAEIENEYLRFLYGYQEVVLLEINQKRVESYVVGVEKNGQLCVQAENKMQKFDIKAIKWCFD